MDILSVATRLGLKDFVKTGKNYKCLCPLHTEKTPSFTLYPHTNTFYCFGKCGINGSMFDLIMKINNVSYWEAKSWFESNFGTYTKKITLPKLQHKPLKKINSETIEYWHNNLYYCNREPFFTDRLFTRSTIKEQAFGWDGKRYIIPIWYEEPRVSPCICVRKRASELCNSDEFKYIGKKGYNPPTIYGKWDTRDTNIVFIFAGELDARLANQDGIPSISLVNGVNSYKAFIKNWALLQFYNVKYAVICFDRKESHIGANLASEWKKQKGDNTSFVFQWGKGEFDDYNEFRLSGHTKLEFIELVTKQIKNNGVKKLIEELSYA